MNSYKVVPMDAIAWVDWLVAVDETECHRKLGREWEDGCCQKRRGRLVRLRLALWLMLAERGYVCWVDQGVALG
ncbi:hypothetical protein [Leptolyngbya sp. PCC 6406]|uniref:hypothetical protein n=1 Tax=Leptolyngbya sp. PCC 6406 TaxID=1173264 RepID=UPI0002AC18AB|nr:hypothetical protein [Leptolyngbya sp. PCC 6406]